MLERNNNFYVGNGRLPYKLLFVTGVCRSGKTTLSRLLGSLQNMEWIEEPYELSMLLWSMECGNWHGDFEWERQVFTGICKELVNETVLLRRGNFRPNDLSTLWNYKEGKEIFDRLVNLNTREEVEKYIQATQRSFVIDIPNILGQADFIRQSSEDMIWFHVVRNPYDVAQAVLEKHWFSDERMKYPDDNSPYRKYVQNGETYYIPWWLEEEREEKFIDAGEYERGIIYWLSVEKNSGTEIPGRDFLVKYEDLVTSVEKVLGHICSRIGAHPTGRTTALCGALHGKFIVGGSGSLRLSAHYQSRLDKLKEMYGYE